MLIPGGYFYQKTPYSDDIFSYFRSYYKVSSPHDAGLISIIASSTTLKDVNNQSDVSCLLSDSKNERWVSQEEINASFSIDFYQNRVNLLSYSIQTEALRYIKSWDLFGIDQYRCVLLDRRKNEPICQQ